MIRLCCKSRMLLVVTFVSLAITHLAFEGVIQFLQEMGRQLDDPKLATSLLPSRAFCPTLAAAFLVAYRVVSRHPHFDTDYRLWLERTPWTPAKALPLGRIWPQWLDLVWLAGLCWLGSGVSAIQTIAPALAYMGTWCGLAFFVAITLRQRAVLFSLLFAAGLALRLAPTEIGPAFVLLAAWPVAIVGLKQSLNPKIWPTIDRRDRPSDHKGESDVSHLGWPFGQLSPRTPPRRVSRLDGVAISLLVGWFAYGLFSIATPMPSEGWKAVVSIAGMVLLFSTVAWMLAYLLGRASPLTLAGRIATGRWIVPRYDRIFVPPLLAWGVFFLGETMIYVLDLPLAFTQPVVFGTCAFLLSCCGPTLAEWELTGGQRITPAGRVGSASGFLKV